MEGARPARAEDLDPCERLLDAALDAVSHRRGGPQLLASAAGAARSNAGSVLPVALALLESWHGDDAHHLLVGTVDDTVVGLAAGHCVALGADTLGVVDVMYVEPGARGIGVGSAMTEQLLGWFAGRGCHDVDALALPGDRETKQLFESFGLSARLLVLHRRLP